MLPVRPISITSILVDHDSPRRADEGSGLDVIAQRSEPRRFEQTLSFESWHLGKCGREGTITGFKCYVGFFKHDLIHSFCVYPIFERGDAEKIGTIVRNSIRSSCCFKNRMLVRDSAPDQVVPRSSQAGDFVCVYGSIHYSSEDF